MNLRTLFSGFFSSVHIPCGVFGKVCEKRIVLPATSLITKPASIAAKESIAIRVRRLASILFFLLAPCNCERGYSTGGIAVCCQAVVEGLARGEGVGCAVC